MISKLFVVAYPINKIEIIFFKAKVVANYVFWGILIAQGAVVGPEQ